MPTDAKTEVIEVLRDFAKSFANHDAEACAGIYTDDAILLPPDAPALTDKAAIAAMFRGLFDGGARSNELRTLDVIDGGGLVVETGEFTFFLESGSMEGKYLAVWQRQEDGTLKCHREAFNSSAPAS
jgi:ketosteroid isomerase-like protein